MNFKLHIIGSSSRFVHSRLFVDGDRIADIGTQPKEHEMLVQLLLNGAKMTEGVRVTVLDTCMTVAGAENVLDVLLGEQQYRFDLLSQLVPKCPECQAPLHREMDNDGWRLWCECRGFNQQIPYSAAKEHPQ